MKAWMWVSLVGVVLSLSGVLRAEEEAKGTDPVALIAQALEEVVRPAYPQVRLRVDGNRILAEHDARTFLVHHLNKKYEWMDAVKERGPRSRGVVFEARYVGGRYLSALATGVFDERYYHEHRMVQYDPDLGHHLHVVLRLPAMSRHPAPDGFAERIQTFVKGFAEHVGE